MIHSIYVINRSGETLAAINRGKFEMDESLFGGFLSAIQMYSQKISGKNVKELSLDEYRLVISDTTKLFLVTIHDSEDKNSLNSNTMLRDILADLGMEIITDDVIESLKKAADKADGKTGTATDWASKML
ncbi:MAG: hypothetical protein ACFFED_05090 [Candidatus Thorarchaeota archaeon]